MQSTASDHDIQKIVSADHYLPNEILGVHELEKNGSACVSIRAFVPGAKSLQVVPEAKSTEPVEMLKLHENGFFEAVFHSRRKKFKYYFKASGFSDHVWEFQDAYRFPSIFSEQDKHLFNEGKLTRLYEKLGAQIMELAGVKGVCFSVWAPNARRVSVVGNFNSWDGRLHMMNAVGQTGVWELFIPGIDAGEIYKFEIKTQEGALRIKTDPMAFRGELRPANASITHALGRYQWGDENWLQERKNQKPLKRPTTIYEVHLGSWKRRAEENNRVLNYRELAHELADYVLDLGYTHIELMPVAEHPYDGSWGYQVTGYYAPTSRYGPPDDFKYFVDHIHQKGIGVILDWVPAHFPKDDFALRFFDGTALYEHEDPRKGEHPDWGTLIFNYGRNEVRNFLISNALFWFDEYHIDGLRVDAVASMLYLDYSREGDEWLPNQFGGRENLEAIEFMQKLSETVCAEFPDALMIAEESTSWPNVSKPTYIGGLGFHFKWNMGWMNDFLEYMSQDPVHKKFHHNELTFSLWYAFSENFILVLSHDEVVHGKGSLIGKMPGDEWQKFANLRLLYAMMYAHPGKKLLFMGGEFGQWNEWNATESLDWGLLGFEKHGQLRDCVRELNKIYSQNCAMWQRDAEPEGFQWIDYQDADHSVIALMRKGDDPNDFVVVVCNFTPVPRFNYHIGVPESGFYDEIFNSDSEMYGGSNLGNYGGVKANSQPEHGFDFSLSITLPPLCAVYFKPRRDKTREKQG